jgi:hypothetical protein
MAKKCSQANAEGLVQSRRPRKLGSRAQSKAAFHRLGPAADGRPFGQLWPQKLSTLRPIQLDILLPSGHSNQKLQRANLESANFAPFNLVWLSRPGPNAWRLWLALKSEELERGQNMDGALVIQGADNVDPDIGNSMANFPPQSWPFPCPIESS